MALGTVCHAKFFELAVVLVLMATGTIDRQTVKFTMFKTRFRFVAVATGCFTVYPL